MVNLSARRALTSTYKAFPFRVSASLPPDPSLSLLQLLQLSIDHCSLTLVRQSHARVCRCGFEQHSVIVTKLVSAYSVCKNPVHSRLVFDSVPVRNVYLWNALINGYAKNELYRDSFHLFSEMCRSEDSPDEFTFSTLSKVSGDVGDLIAGKIIHGRCMRIGFVSDAVVSNSLMALYCRCGNFDESEKLFDEMPMRIVSSWNTIIAGYANSGKPCFDGKFWKLVKLMQAEGLKLDAFTISILLPLCGGVKGKWDRGRELHCYIVKNGLELSLGSDVHLGCCLIDMCSKSNKLDTGRQVFNQLKNKNVFAWTAMINGYVENGKASEGLVLFREMQGRDRIEPNKVSLVSVLPACSSLASLMAGKQIHGFSIRKELNRETSLCNALIDMYSKCGSLNCARKVFEYGCIHKDTISWSTMISGYGLHGKAEEATDLYDKMLQLGIKPDILTIVGVLSACGRSGLVDAGLKIYNYAVNNYGITPTMEMCSCVVDMLGRSGRLDKALDFINTMHVEPGPSVWGALVNTSALHENVEMRDLAYKFLIQIEPGNPSNYVSLSNMYASSRRWDVVAELRTVMKERGLRKLPGCSWVNINGENHSFYVGDKAHPSCDMIYDILGELTFAMRRDDYVPEVENLIV